MLRVYLAARYSRHPEMLGYAAQLRAIGYDVTSRWINGGHEMSKEGSTQAEQEERIRFAQEDWADLRAASLCIAFTETPRSSNSRGGRHVELGAALAWAKEVIVVGPAENVFCCLPSVRRFEVWEECAAFLANKLGRVPVCGQELPE